MAVCGKCVHKNVCELCKELGFKDVVRANDFNCTDYLSTADFVEVKHGYWIDKDDVYEISCSECGAIEKPGDSNYRTPRCPICGAKMDGGKRKK